MTRPSSDVFLNLRLLSYWITAVEEGSVTAAAKRISIPQPALSQQIRTLERAIGGSLLERLPTGVQLTDAGRALLPEARAAVAAGQRGLQAAREALKLERGRLEFGSYATLLSGALLSSLHVWHTRYPDTSVRALEFNRHTLVENTAQGAVDFGIGLPPPAWSGPVVDLGWDEFVIVGRLTSRRPVRLESLADSEWILYHSQHGLSELMAEACHVAGFSPHGAIETSQAEAAARLAATGLGYALVPKDNVPEGLQEYVRPLTRPVTWPIAVFTRRTWSPSAAAYLEILLAQHWPAPADDALVLTFK
ncbi:MAG: LysR family transcriptional regulator [Solirubrobacteraceae bacterium]|nr:LysR family transcriptional regulator [Solirubrobacteraceae bacterium]